MNDDKAREAAHAILGRLVTCGWDGTGFRWHAPECDRATLELTAKLVAAEEEARVAREALAEFVAEQYPGQNPKPWKYDRGYKAIWNATGERVRPGGEIGPLLGALIVRWFSDPPKRPGR